jgi:polysaccharide pyruvyl transferase WcaK-like protein
LFSTDVPDRNVVADIVARLATDATLGERVSHPHTETLEQFFQEIATVDYVVASRLHGILLSHLCRIPVLAISYDRKVDTYMEDMRLSKYCLDLHEVSVKSLVATFEDLARTSRVVREELDRRTGSYADDLRDQYDRVLEPW